MRTDDFIFGFSYFCVGGVTIRGAIGIRDYPKSTYEQARRLYLTEARLVQANLGLSDKQMLKNMRHRTNETFRGFYSQYCLES